MDPVVVCGNCRQRIEHCEGSHGEWMHCSTSREFCSRMVGMLARPETEPEMTARQNNLRRR